MPHTVTGLHTELHFEFAAWALKGPERTVRQAHEEFGVKLDVALRWFHIMVRRKLMKKEKRQGEGRCTRHFVFTPGKKLG